MGCDIGVDSYDLVERSTFIVLVNSDNNRNIDISEKEAGLIKNNNGLCRSLKMQEELYGCSISERFIQKNR